MLKPIITGNSFYNNASYHIQASGFYDRDKTILDATGNWWGTTDLALIANKVYESADNAYSPAVDYRQLLMAENGQPLAGEQVLGDVYGEARWQFTEGTVLASVNVKANSHLIIEPGTELKFAKNSQLKIEKNARLTIMGDKAAPITLTSNEATKAAGDWQGIRVDAESGPVVINHATIEYANNGVNVYGKQAKAAITHSQLINNNYGLQIYGGYAALNDHPQVNINNSVIDNSTHYHVYAHGFNDANSRYYNARGNYWGSNDQTQIDAKIYDYNDYTRNAHIDTQFARFDASFDITANAGEDVIGFGTVETTLSGSGTSPSAITSYQWQQYLGNPVTLNNANTQSAAFTVADVTTEELMSFILTVTDENDISAADKVDVVIKPFAEYNQKPAVDASQEVLVASDDAVLVKLNATDGDNDPLTYQWTQTYGAPVTLQVNNTDTLAFVAPSNTRNQVYSFKLTVNDGFYVVEREVTVAVKAKQNSTGTYYYHNDHLGTPQLMTDSSATVVWQASYTPFGEATIGIETVTNNIRFPGQYYDEESGLHYNYFRDYDPELGRYIQSDPIGLAGGINTYAYVEGNPTNYSDPLGLWSTEAHNYFIDMFFAYLPVELRNSLKRGSRFADSARYQFGFYGHMHAMSDGKSSLKQQCQKMNAYIKHHMKLYADFAGKWAANPNSSQGKKYKNKAFFQLGMALHAAMDFTSPAHSGFQYFDLFSLSSIRRHGNLPGTLENLNAAKDLSNFTNTMIQMNKVMRGDELGGCECE